MKYSPRSSFRKRGRLCGLPVLLLRYSSGDFEDHVLSSWLGLTMMAILADECAGERRRITDETDSYRAVENVLIQSSGGKIGANDDLAERLVNLSLATVDPDNLDLATLVHVRKKEDALLRSLRTSFMHRVDSAIRDIGSAKANSREVERVQRQFQRDLEDDFAELKRLLRVNAAVSLFSKSVIVGVGIAAGVLVEPVGSALVLAGSLGGDLLRVNSSRREVLQSHATSWLYKFDSAFRLL